MLKTILSWIPQGLYAAMDDMTLEHERILKTFADELSAVTQQRDDAYAERDAAHADYTAAATRELHARDIATRALTLLQDIDTTRTGGKQLRTARETLLADAMLQGLWGEIKE